MIQFMEWISLMFHEFMAWERSFEARVLKVREKELKYQKINYTVEVGSAISLAPT